MVSQAPTMLSYNSAVIIALDASPLSLSTDPPTGGIARYTTELAGALARRFPENHYHLLCDRAFAGPAAAPPNLHASPASAPGIVDRRWWTVGLARALARLDAQVFHGTDFSVPYLPLRASVMTVHDLSPWLDRAWQPAASRIRRRTAALLRARVPTMIVTPSQAVRRAVIDRFHWPEARIAAVPLAASEHFRPVVSPPPRPYFVFVGTLEPRKNIARLLDAWRELRAQHDVDLVIAGRCRDDFPPIPPEPGLRLPGPVPDADLPALYSNALAVVYPSLYEGFGLPVLEAMQCGALVVTSRDPAILETAGDAAISVDARDTRALAEALLAIAADPARFADLRARALAQCLLFSWARTAEMTQEVYAEAWRRFHA